MRRGWSFQPQPRDDPGELVRSDRLLEPLQRLVGRRDRGHGSAVVLERHWNFLRLLKQTHGLRKKVWILTTTDKKALDAAVGASGVIEIIFGEPYGVREVVEAVHHALSDGRPIKSEE